MNPCEHLKETLVAEGREGIEHNPALAAHRSGCTACQDLLRAWDQVPQLLEQLPQHEPGAAVLDRIRQNIAEPDSGRVKPGRRRFIAPSLASAAVLLAAIGLSRELLMHEAPKMPIPSDRQLVVVQTAASSGYDTLITEGFDDDSLSLKRVSEAKHPALVEQERLEDGRVARSDDAPLSSVPEEVRYYGERDAAQRAGVRANDADLGTAAEPHVAEKPGSKQAMSGQFMARRKEQAIAAPPSAPPAARSPSNERLAESSLRPQQSQNLPLDEFRSRSIDRTADLKNLKGKLEAEPLKKDKFAADRLQEKAAAARPAVVGGYAGNESNFNIATGFDFLGHYQQTYDVLYQPAEGYWANSYMPGDPEIRLLSARLAQWDRSWLHQNTALERAVVPVSQPFDAPADNALALSLMADAAGVAARSETHDIAGFSPTRLRVQVGIRGIEHRRGQRPAMNVGVVVDLPADAADEVRIAARALLDALLQSRQTGDRFSLVLTGQAGKNFGLVVPADEFRFGSLQLAQRMILGQEALPQQPDDAAVDTSYIDVYGALQRAGAMVQENDDPSRPLGSSSVLLISARPIEDLDRVTALVHERATEGITLSVFPLGDQAQGQQAQQLVLAGLGNRRFLEAPSQARQLIEDELHASSRAVARAARLSIRLAPGVRLIGVVGSERLDVQRAQRVRDIEASMDHRLANELGIQADRGEDEQGIQIVIPSIYSGDSVTVLLDVVTDRPGAIADVSLRYKDLVFLRNGRLQSQLELPAAYGSGPGPERGPAELAVLKNLLSHHFVLAVQQAAEALGRHQADAAIALLRGMHATLEQARKELPAWERDPDLIRDQQVLERYIEALGSPQADAQYSNLADSLQFAAWAKSHRPLEEWK